LSATANLLALPPGISATIAAVLVCASFFTSALTAAFGLGGGVAMLSLLGYFLPVAALIPVHGVIQLGSNAGRMTVFRSFVRWDCVLPFAAGAFAGAILGAGLVMRADDGLLKLALGLFIIAISWIRFPALANAGSAVFAAGGVSTTFLTMFFGATGPLTAIFFASAFGDRRNYSGSHAAAMTVQHGGKVIAFAVAGFAFADWLPMLAAMILSGYLGTLTGSRLLIKLPEARFRTIFRWLITLLGADIARRGFIAWLG
jgi:uncharacterized membrane protein YfcA